MATTIKSRKKNQQKSVPTLLQAIEKVVELAEDSKMSEEFMLIRHCDNERLDEKNVKRIGF